MEMILFDDKRKVGVGMLVEAAGQQHDRAEIGGAAPELREQLTLHANVLHPLVVSNGLGHASAPIEQAVHVLDFLVDGRNFFVERNSDHLV